MNNYEKALELFKSNRGFLKTSDLDKHGIPRYVLSKLVKDCLIEKTSRGLYVLIDVLDDVYLDAQNTYKRGIFALGTALYLHDLSDRVPDNLTMFFPSNYNVTNAKANGILAHRVSGDYYSLGLTTATTYMQNVVVVYDAEKTLCDILRKTNHLDIQLITDAFKMYCRRKDKNIPKLSEYSRTLNVQDKVRSYLEVLL